MKKISELAPIIFRVLTFCLLVVMAVMDYRTKTVPSIFPLFPAGIGIWMVDYLLRSGFTIGFYWFYMIIASGIIGIAMYLTKAWSFADSLTVATASMTLFAVEGGIFNLLCLVAYIGYAINVHRTGKFKSQFPFMIIIAVAYPIATFLG